MALRPGSQRGPPVQLIALSHDIELGPGSLHGLRRRKRLHSPDKFRSPDTSALFCSEVVLVM
jgi:hypothetical protein